MTPDARVERFATEISRTMRCDLGVARETAVAVLKQLDAAGLAVIVKNNFPGPDLVWDIGDPEPGADVEGVFDFTHEDYDEVFDPDSPRWGRVTGPMAGHWKGYKNGSKVYLEWAELVRRWGPVRRG